MTSVAVPQLTVRNEDAESDWMTPEELWPKCEPGDLIEFYRGFYRHWAMYSDSPGYVFNIDAEDMNNTRAKVSLRTLVEVANYGDCPKHRVVRINNKKGSARRRGLKTRSMEQVIEDAQNILDTVVPYEFTNRNCEYYCCLWKFGRGWTDQISKY